MSEDSILFSVTSIFLLLDSMVFLKINASKMMVRKLREMVIIALKILYFESPHGKGRFVLKKNMLMV